MLEQDTTQGKESIALAAKQKPWYATWWGVLILFVLLLVLSFTVAFGFALRDSFKKLANQKTTTSVLSVLTKVDNARVAGANYSLGADNPTITIVEFGDFSCGYTKNLYPVLRDLVINHSRDYKFIYRDLPILKDNSVTLARAARCAGEQGLFWPMHDYLFQNQGSVETQEQILAAAQKIQADKLLFATCMEAEKYTKEIGNDAKIAEKFNLQGTPTIFINNYQLPTGEVTREYLEQVIQEIKQQ